MSKKNLGIYIHIPFCQSKCAYCDFLSGPADDDRKKMYMKALLREVEEKCTLLRESNVHTLFIGGGTPSVVDEAWIVEVLDRIQSYAALDREAEITIECNPKTVTKHKLSAYFNAGINRISFGLQSVHNEELKFLGRIHTYEDFLESYDMARDAGFSNINIDLISALPGQTSLKWEETLRKTAMLKPEHISAYSLIIEPGTPFYDRFGEGGTQDSLVIDEDLDRYMYHRTLEILMEYGFERYEISNYARGEQYECRHNMSYWDRIPYLGLGLGAASLLEHTRYTNTKDMGKYLQGQYEGECEMLSKTDEIAEHFFLGLRKIKGVGLTPYEERYGELVKKLEAEGLLIYKEGRIALTARGIDISNYVMAQFI